MTKDSLSYRQIMIGRSMTGLVGLDEAIATLVAENATANDPDVGERLVAIIRQHNYVPDGAKADYAQALAMAYADHVEGDANTGRERTWRDPRRVHLNWFPVVLEAKCDGCGECISVCPCNVWGWNEDHTKALVLEPYECAPGCQLCAKSCRRRAIIMPPREALHHLYRMRSG